MKYKGTFKYGLINKKGANAASLVCSNESIEIKNSNRTIIRFQPKDIISLENNYGTLKITHRLRNFQRTVNFTYINPNEIINYLESIGFTNNINSVISKSDLKLIKERDSFPFKLIPLIVLLTIGFSFSIVNYFNSSFSHGYLINILIFLSIGITTLTLKPIQTIFLKEGKKVEDIHEILFLLILVCMVIGIRLINF